MAESSPVGGSGGRWLDCGWISMMAIEFIDGWDLGAKKKQKKK